jgi:uncharacterized protein (DUF2126 family)
MPIRVALHHRTSYSYSKLVQLAPQVVRLRPAAHCRTPVLSYSLKVNPEKHFVNWQQDPHGNFLARLVFPDKTRQLCVTVDLVAEMTVINPFAFFLQDEALEYPFPYEPSVRMELLPFLETLPTGPRLTEFLAGIPRQGKKTVDFLVDLNQYVHRAVKYLIRMEPGVQMAEETLALTSGSCRDSAWLMVQVLRNLGLAARFVSGYLIQLKPDMKPLDGPPGPGADFTDLHAWAEVYLPGAGWVGLDPTSGLLAGEGHLPLAATPVPDSAAPITGAVDMCEVDFSVHMSVTRVADAPRVTKPYTEEQWDAVEQLGHEVDARLEALDVRLTMGGEPTFVSIDDMDGPEWNITADSPEKRRLAGTLLRRLSHCYGRGALLHFGQGKLYPGEPLPRWALGCYWRKDGEPMWRKPELIAADSPDPRANAAKADAFIRNLSERLVVHADHIIPGYEDVWYYLWKERRLPANVDPLKADLKDELERKRLARIFERGLSQIVGYALPIRPIASDGVTTRWESGRWFLRQENLFLYPGDSPMGYRMPIDSLPWYAQADTQPWEERDPMAPRGPLPTRAWRDSGGNGYAAPARRGVGQLANLPGGGQLANQPGVGQVADLPYPGFPLGSSMQATATLQQIPGIARAARPRRDRGPAALAVRDWAEPFAELLIAEPTSQTIRTALCVEPREGRMHVFMPPIARLEDYLNLVEAIEDTAEELEMPVMIEGYPPPWDYRLRHFKVTPDPGVIEVNLQPSENWNDLVSNTTTLYDEARRSRLGTEKFMTDGRHTGTGGGNHIVMGGAKPVDSPFLRRPELLRSLVAYWNNRPSLSYLFSGLFVGPTSQCPRVDEARHEGLYELETAFTQLPDGAAPPWLVDRLFRNLLVDLTGNTHRAEFCIDKLYSPDSAQGRLGLVEFRSFEMPPHARMSLTQQLLMRAMAARFWERPYRQPLVRWGTSLHDRFMLPHFVVQDFLEVVGELREWGMGFQPEWFVPHFEFRFPLMGEVTYEGVKIELRQAIEPWHVLGEESASTGTARYVDSSVERLQVKVCGMTGRRHLVACNGRRVPLHPTGTPGEYVAGVRYRAWQPPSCLHPTIGVHAPLVFDLYDRWSGRSIGGCTWHVSHPGGVNFDTFPVNALDAESRRASRFHALGHTVGSSPLPKREHNTDYPMTLDLRRPLEITELREDAT